MDGPGASKKDFEVDDGGGGEDGGVGNVKECPLMLILSKGAFPWSVLALSCLALAWFFIDISYYFPSYLSSPILYLRCPGS